MKKLIRNRAKCKICGEVLESTYRHDFKTCECGAMSVDGGLAYIRRGWDPQYGDKDAVIEEMNEYEEVEE